MIERSSRDRARGFYYVLVTIEFPVILLRMRNDLAPASIVSKLLAEQTVCKVVRNEPKCWIAGTGDSPPAAGLRSAVSCIQLCVSCCGIAVLLRMLPA